MFFSTYLESIWLLQLCIAVDLLEAAGAGGQLTARVRDRVIEPAIRLIVSFDEGGSNRQVWNNAAALAAGRVLGDNALVDRAVHGRSGMVAHLSQGLLADGSWFEGENYHVFAHRGLWYCLTMAECAGLGVPPALGARFNAGFVTPWLTALPDMTLPARRDSPHAVSLRQWRFAELAELGLARFDEQLLRGALAALYDSSVLRGDTGRSRSAADVERNEPATSLTRADLGWRALLHARPVLAGLTPAPARSALLGNQGIGVLRRARGQIYAAMDYGHSGGGHGHPDRLNVILCDTATRWLDDPGTGSYVDPTLHWYRSTLAHNAPLVDGHSQMRVHGELVAFEDRDKASWIEAAVDGIAPGVRVRRSLVVTDDYAIDVVEWNASRKVCMDLPLHVEGDTADAARWEAGVLNGAGGLEDGYDFVRDARRAQFTKSSPDGGALAVRLMATMGSSAVTAHLFADPPIEWWHAVAPGPPGAGDRGFHLARWTGVHGRLTTVWDLRGAMESCIVTGDSSGQTPGHHGPGSGAGHGVVVRLTDGAVHVHRRTETGWQIAEGDGDGRTITELGGLARSPEHSDPAALSLLPSRADPEEAVLPQPHMARPRVIGTDPLVFELGAAHYRRSEPAWEEAGQPRATVTLRKTDDALVIDIDIVTPAPVFVAADAVNELDNEHPDINGDGVQLHLHVPGMPVDGYAMHADAVNSAAQGYLAAFMAIPEPGRGVRVREIAGPEAGWMPGAEWQPTGTGYSLRLLVPRERLAGYGRHPFTLDVIVNESAPGRARRRGQLVLSGARGEWVYLRGDRHPASRHLSFTLDDA